MSADAIREANTRDAPIKATWCCFHASLVGYETKPPTRAVAPGTSELWQVMGSSDDGVGVSKGVWCDERALVTRGLNPGPYNSGVRLVETYRRYNKLT